MTGMEWLALIQLVILLTLMVTGLTLATKGMYR